LIRRAFALINTRPGHRRPASGGAWSNYTKPSAEPDDHALGRSRGGWTTKIHALVNDNCAAVTLRLTAGQAHDNPQLAPLVAAYTAAHGRRFRLLADKGYAHNSTRIHLRKHRITHTIPERSDQLAHRKAQGSRGGRPPAFDPLIYRHRNTVERGFNRSNIGAA